MIAYWYLAPNSIITSLHHFARKTFYCAFINIKKCSKSIQHIKLQEWSWNRKVTGFYNKLIVSSQNNSSSVMQSWSGRFRIARNHFFWFYERLEAFICVDSSSFAVDRFYQIQLFEFNIYHSTEKLNLY